MSFDEIFDLTAGVYFNFYNIYSYNIRYFESIHVSYVNFSRPTATTIHPVPSVNSVDR